MDGFSLFRKLGSGAKFNYTRFKKDAEVLQIRSADPPATVRVKLSESNAFKHVPQNIVKRAQTQKRQHDSESDSSESDDSDQSDSCSISSQSEAEPESELKLLGNMKSKHSEISDKPKKKKRKKTSQLLAALKQEKINHLRNDLRIHAYGTDVPDPVTGFEELKTRFNCHTRILENIESAGYQQPTPIQTQVIPAMMQRREVMACAPTGSGKTAAFILPILHHLQEPRNQGFRALVLAPTRELAKQIYREFQILADGIGFRIHYLEKSNTAVKKFGPKSSKKFDILVTTPNRLVFMLKQDPPLLNLENVEWLIIDESDKLFEDGKTGFRDQLGEIYKACSSPHVRRAMFSATFAYDVEEWCKLNLDNVLQVYIGARNSATESIDQELQFVGSESGKLIAVRDIIRKGIQPPVLVFVQSKDRAKELFHEMIYDGLNIDVIHADRSQLQRDNVIRCFRSGKIWILICTELMGRGIDFKGVNLVINYDFPTSAISYIHRIGRTGRAGRKGKAITFFTEDDTVYLRSIANVMKEAGCLVPEFMLRLSKAAKKNRRRLARSAPRRDSISTMPKMEAEKLKRTRNIIRKQKKKQKLKG